MARQNRIDFHKKLILFKYILSLFRIDNIEDIAQNIKDTLYEDIDISTNHTRFYQVISNKTIFEDMVARWDESNWDEAVWGDGGEYLTKAQLEQYDENIVRFTNHISEKRERPIRWKYFQYLELLFTEIYLDKYFSNKEQLLNSLNTFREKFNADLGEEKIEEYSESDLNKLAFWAATGSGKTLILHVNILQFQHYIKKYNKQKDFNRIILITPNEGLSKQHKEELELSNISANYFDKNSLSKAPVQLTMNTMQGTNQDFTVDIIEITKLAEEDGDKTVAVDAFETNNLILVDEGHRGTSGSNDGKWITRRNAISSDGFCFEYSATFGQAVTKDEKLTQEYAKCTLFDYSYKYFYGDGYGKEYQILNLADDSDEERRNQYLTACLLTYFQQVILYKNKQREFAPFLLENPLWVFVGGSVNAVRTENRKQVSDVVDILLFIKDFVSNRQNSIEFLNNLLNGHDGFLDSRGLNIFENKFSYLLKQTYTGETLFSDILKEIFNSEQTEANLYIENLKGVDGEIGLRLGENEYFGVINVGDNDNLIKLCDANGLITSSKEFSESLFHGINKVDSTINILIGSKKFTEGWSSWRVSTMGLMNIGKSEGSQIIQLFGRGVRLKGANFTLKRSNEQDVIPLHKVPEHIRFVETLNIFGVKADYMATFKEYLEKEGVPTGDKIEFILPAISNLGNVSHDLKMPRIKDGISFKKDGGTFVLGDVPDSFIRRQIILDLYSKVDINESKSRNAGEVHKDENNKLTAKELQFIDYQELYFEIQKFKNEKQYYNFSIPFDMVKKIISNNSWYKLLIPNEEFEFTNFDKVIKYQDIATRLMKKYLERFYNMKKDEWESNYREYVSIDEDDPNMVKEYKIYIEESRQDIITKLEELKSKIDSGNYSIPPFYDIVTMDWTKHLFSPLISFEGDYGIKISPVQLNADEMIFVEDLKKYYEENTSFFNGKELYLLRNQSKGKGVGFFQEAGFFPDFILWFIKDNKQYITFIDPKGILHMNIGDDKIQFHKKIKEIQSQMNDDSIIMNSVVLSNTSYDMLRISHSDAETKELYNENNVIFQQEENYIQQILDCVR